ncbi:MAG: dsRNA-specific ribonuclease [Euryarchaeota archaeon]|nr:dsRNA-specific ribonuclease [Euryarchaeota archaeon]MBU4138894.1 dsRNA-specific ribonuclease [Euryarchaeota archaeon]
MTIEETLGYSFKNAAYLDRALTRKAYANEQKQQHKDCEDQEIYRTLGDAVLKLVLVDLLIRSGCDTRDDITLKKKDLEREEKLAEFGRNLGIGQAIKLGVGEKKQRASEEPKVLAETLEAIIAAIYLDGGFESAKETISKWFRI